MIVRLIKLLDKLINVIVLCFFFLCLLIAALGIYDALTVYQGANATNYQQYKKKGVQFDDLLAINSDVMAWLTVKGTHIDYPIVQGENNLEYINKSVEGEYSLSGSVFLDYRNKVTFEDKYSLIYAHHMAGNVMFGELPNFRKKSFFNKHKEFSIETKTKQKLKINIFACIQTDAFDSLLFNPIDVDISSKNEFLNHIKQKSVQYREILTTNESRFVALSTCEDMTTDGRIIVIGQIE